MKKIPAGTIWKSIRDHGENGAWMRMEIGKLTADEFGQVFSNECSKTVGFLANCYICILVSKSCFFRQTNQSMSMISWPTLKMEWRILFQKFWKQSIVYASVELKLLCSQITGNIRMDGRSCLFQRTGLMWWAFYLISFFFLM